LRFTASILRMREDGPWVSFALRFAFRTPTTSSPPIGWNPLKLADLGGRSSSVIVAGQAQGAKVVKTFNSLTMANFEKGPTEGNGRRVLSCPATIDPQNSSSRISSRASDTRSSISAISMKAVVSSSQAGHSPARICCSQAEARRIGQRCK
jgi:hypothetical protein